LNKYTLGHPSFGNRKLQQALNVFAFFLAFPSLDVLGNSFYFYAFVIILLETKNSTRVFLYRSTFNKFLVVLFVLGFISSITHPILGRDPGFFAKAILIFHFAYWFIIAAYFSNWIRYINLFQLAKWITIGYIVQSIGFYFLSFKFNLVLLSFSSGMTRNGFVFNSICFAGFIFYYFYIRYGKKSVPYSASFIFLNLILTNGRAGAVVSVLIILLSFSVIYSHWNKIGRVTLIIGLAVMLTFSFSDSKVYKIGTSLSPYFATVNPRFAELLTGENQGDLSFDKSWLIRELMIDKAFEINEQYKYFGIGWGNFKNYSAELSTLKSYDRLMVGKDKEWYNKRSAHNSYALYLAEAGWVGSVVLIFILVPVLFWSLLKIWQGAKIAELLIFISLIGASLHLYSIAAITGANFWTILGISNGLMHLNKDDISRKKNPTNNQGIEIAI
jgi:O-antigen ligase/polysaccharide polymerase Wzy-like membrane protein